MQHTFKQLARNITLFVLMFAIAVVTPVEAAIASPAKPKITFSFDDGRASVITNAAPTLAKYNISGTAYITTGCVGMVQTPNTCHAASDVSYVTWDQIKALQTTYNWEIGSHSKTHPYMASTNANDSQPNMLTPEQVISELNDSKADLAAHGFNATAYASPYGDYSPYVLQEIAKDYTSHRGFADQKDNVWPYNDLLLNDMQVQGSVSVADVKAKIDYAIANNLWLVLTFHDILAKPSRNTNKYQWGTSQLDTIAAYVKSKRDAGLISTLNASGGLATGTTNLLPGADFTAGIANGWRTDQPSIFTADQGSHGSLPEVTSSIRINGNSLSTSAHLFSPLVPVNSNTLYLIKSYLNITGISTGEIGYYIDEYDAAGNWVSGQFKTRQTDVFAENINMSYTPSSIRVKQASLQIYSTANSQASGFLDSLGWYTASSSTGTTQTNLLPSGTFNTPWTDGWTTDDTAGVTQVTATASNPENYMSAHITNRTSHLFSPKIGVDATKSYYLENDFNITSTNGGEIGVYIDEYDAVGNWVSGQYKLTRSATGSATTAFTYAPTSITVVKAQLQIIFSSSSTLDATVDNSRWTQL